MSLLLADYLAGPAGREFEGCIALELGAGTGLSGLLLARTAQRVFLTGMDAARACCAAGRCCAVLPYNLNNSTTPADAGEAVLQNLRGNASANAAAASAATRELDWLRPPGWLLRGAGGSNVAADPSPFGWQPADLGQLRGLRCILAADCVYDNDLTEGMMRTAAALLRWAAEQAPGRQREEAVLLVALERRVCFTLAGLRECAPAYDFWRTTFTAEEAGPSSSESSIEGAAGASGSGKKQPAQNLTSPPLLGQRIDAGGVPQRVGGYARSDYLELWELRLDPGVPAAAATEPEFYTL